MRWGRSFTLCRICPHEAQISDGLLYPPTAHPASSGFSPPVAGDADLLAQTGAVPAGASLLSGVARGAWGDRGRCGSGSRLGPAGGGRTGAARATIKKRPSSQQTPWSASARRDSLDRGQPRGASPDRGPQRLGWGGRLSPSDLNMEPSARNRLSRQELAACLCTVPDGVFWARGEFWLAPMAPSNPIPGDITPLLNCYDVPPLGASSRPSPPSPATLETAIAALRPVVDHENCERFLVQAASVRAVAREYYAA